MFSAVLLLGGSIFLFCRHLRKLYRIYDEKETMKEEIGKYEYLISDAMKYFHENYCNDYDNTIYENARINEEFIHRLLKKRPLEKQLYYLRKLYERLYEMNYRIKTNSNDIMKIISPLKSLREELVREQLNYIGEMIKTDEF